jgi:hypothetical protein
MKAPISSQKVLAVRARVKDVSQVVDTKKKQTFSVTVSLPVDFSEVLTKLGSDNSRANNLKGKKIGMKSVFLG